MHVRRTSSGFSLVEATVAVAVVALGCLAVTGVLQIALRAQSAERSRAHVAQVLDAESARLRALPFFARAAGPGLDPVSLAGDVFPHARPWLNVDGLGFQVTDGPGGAFVSLTEVGGLRLRRTARFVRQAAAGIEPLALAEQDGWAVWDATRPPAVILRVELAVLGSSTGAGTREVLIYGLGPLRQQVSGGTPGASHVC